MLHGGDVGRMEEDLATVNLGRIHPDVNNNSMAIGNPLPMNNPTQRVVDQAMMGLPR